MVNAREEFMKHIEGLPILKCAVIRYYDASYKYGRCEEILLKKGFSEADLQEFLDAIDFEYCNGFGGRELFGNIWYEDGTWSSRGDYDGSEWWDYNSCPEIPAECR